MPRARSILYQPWPAADQKINHPHHPLFGSERQIEIGAASVQRRDNTLHRIVDAVACDSDKGVAGIGQMERGQHQNHATRVAAGRGYALIVRAWVKDNLRDLLKEKAGQPVNHGVCLVADVDSRGRERCGKRRRV